MFPASDMLSIPGIQRLFLPQYPCLYTLLPLDAWLQILPWMTGLFVLTWPDLTCPDLTCHIMPLVISGSNFTYSLLGYFPGCSIYLPRILSSKIWVSVLNFWSSRSFGKKKTHISHITYFALFLLLPHLFPFLQTKDILVFQSKASGWMNETIYFPLASLSEKLETFWCKDSAGGRNWHGKIHHKQLESGWVISNWKKVCIKEIAWQPQEQALLLSFAWNMNAPDK